MLESLPVWPAYLITVALFVGIALASLRLPRDELLQDAPDRARWRDIRWWAVLLAAVQLGIYALFH
ncbi:MAG: hypothetical protein R3E86_17155 [Pseudomonadales bacterium]